MEKINGTLDAPFPIVAVCEHQGRMFLATERRIYELVSGEWRPMIFINAEHGMATGS